MISCKHKRFGLCANCNEQKAYTIFRMDDNCKKPNCKCCGYFWGPGAPEHLVNKPARWTK